MEGAEPSGEGTPGEEGPRMVEGDEDLEHVVLVKLLRLNAAVVGVLTGLTLGAAIFLMTLVLVIKGGEVVGPHLALLREVYPGYRVTLLGSLVGFLYGTVSGLLVGYVFARLYNRLAEWRERRHPGHAGS